MKVYDAGTIRNVAIVGHSGCGKTQLIAAMLFAAGAVNRLGRVDDGTTVTDFDDEAIVRKHSLASSLAHTEWLKTKINLIDTPGMANFLTDARSALRVVEAAVVVVDSVHGVEVQTEKLWADAAAANLPRIVVLGRLDRERASLERSLESLHRDCAREIVPIQLPIGEERNFKGVVDLVRMRAFTFADNGSGAMTEGDVPADMQAAAEAARTALVEMVAEADEALMEAFFAEGTLTQEQLETGLRNATRAAKIFPLVCASGTQVIGAQPLLDADRPLRALSARSPVCGDRQGWLRAGGHARPTTRRTPRSCGRPSPTRSPAASPCCGSSTARSSRTPPSTTSPATRRSGWATCWRCRARRRCTCRSCAPATWAPWPS